MKRILLFLLISVLLMISTGCFNRKIVYAGFAKSPQELRGAISIATNTPVIVTVIGDTKTVTSMDLGGMIAVRRADLKKLIELANMATNAKGN